MLADIWQSIPDIIKQAATSPLGMLALMIIVLAILVFFFFKDVGTAVKLVIFIILLVGVIVFAAKVVYKANEVAGSHTSESATPPMHTRTIRLSPREWLKR
jgi:membrane protein implicated in regulation of membrane protease activity